MSDSPRPSDPVRAARVTLSFCVLLTTVPYFVPHGMAVAYPLLLLSTIPHELGHGLTAMLFGANFEQLHIAVDGSGYAVYSGSLSRIAQATIAAGGLVGPAAVAFLCLRVAVSPRSTRWVLVLFALILTYVLVFVRTDGNFGSVVLVILLIVLFALIVRASVGLRRFAVLFMAVQLGLSVFIRSDYLFVSSVGNDEPSDVQQIADCLWLPYWFWGGVCGLLSLYLLFQGLLPHVTRGGKKGGSKSGGKKKA